MLYIIQGEVDVVEVNKSSELSGTPPPSTSLNSTLQSSTEVKGKKESLKKDKKKSKKAQKGSESKNFYCHQVFKQ